MHNYAAAPSIRRFRRDALSLTESFDRHNTWLEDLDQNSPLSLSIQYRTLSCSLDRRLARKGRLPYIISADKKNAKST